MLEKKLRSFGYAVAGVRIAWNEEHNFRFEIFCAVAALGLCWLLGVSRAEFLFIFVVIGFVLTAEVFNTALEELCDKFQSDPDPHIGKIKDLSAGAVFIASVFALITGAIIFLPRLAALL